MGCVEGLEKIAWSSAAGWDPVARGLLFEYYVRILPVWPESSPQILPSDPRVLEAFVSRATEEERGALEHREREVLETWRGRPNGPVGMTQALLPLLLASEMLVDRGALARADDPGVPLFRLWSAGFELNPNHGAVDVLYATGMTAIPLPHRFRIEGVRAAGRRRDL